jgi:hypothetical protein
LANNVTATINSNTSSGPKTVSVSLPSATSSNRLRSLNDVNATSLQDGALLQYDASTDKFTTRNELQTTTGTLKFNGGNF